MKSESFYVTLPSNSSAENKLSDFTTILCEPIQLEGAYEVALVQMTYPSKTEVVFGDLLIKNYFKEIFCYDLDNYTDTIHISLRAESFKNKKIKGEDDLDINFSIRYSVHFDEESFLDELFDEKININGIINNTITFVKIRIPYENTAKFFYAIPESIYKQYVEKNYLKSDNQQDLTRFIIKKGWLYFNYELFLKFYKRISTKYTSIKINLLYITYNFDSIIYTIPKTHYLSHIQTYDVEKNKDKINVDYGKLDECLAKPDNYFEPNDEIQDTNVTIGEEERVRILNDKKIKFPKVKTYDVRIEKCENELNDNMHFKQIKLPEFQTGIDFIQLISNISNAQYILSGRLAGILDDLSFDFHEISLDKKYFYNDTIMENFYIAVYCDIIEPQYFGNKKTELIKCIPVVKEMSKTALINYFDNPHYMPVRLNYINSIRIRLQDLHDNLIRFKSGAQFVVAKLHFKKIK